LIQELVIRLETLEKNKWWKNCFYCF
jgi:hypothetical protein